MKVRCDYCGSMYDDTHTHCPSCGSPNQNVRRSAANQPVTIEDLKRWYESHNLPPYETTRFFIGVDYRGRRAFGIYKDETTGNFIVYKNKDNGSRAVRYEGTDEAYAVNELYQRLKQEIVEQKMSSVNRKSAPNQSANGNSGSGFSKILKIILIIICANTLLTVLPAAALYMFSESSTTKYDHNLGYYNYEGDPYYRAAYNDWFIYSLGTWRGPYETASLPDGFREDTEKYYVGSERNDSLNCTNVSKSEDYKDWANSDNIQEGYYQHSDNTYYHASTLHNAGWYLFDQNDWEEVDEEDVPSDLKRYTKAKDFYTTDTWNPATQVTDFKDSNAYRDIEKEEYRSKDDDWYNDDDYDYDWGSDDSWDSGDTDWDSDW